MTAAKIIHDATMRGAFATDRARPDYGKGATAERRAELVFRAEPSGDGERCGICGERLSWLEAADDRRLLCGWHDNQGGQVFVFRAEVSGCGHRGRFRRLTLTEARR